MSNIEEEGRKNAGFLRQVSVAVVAGLTINSVVALFGDWSWQRLVRNMTEPIIGEDSFTAPWVMLVLAWLLAPAAGAIFEDASERVQEIASLVLLAVLVGLMVYVPLSAGLGWRPF